LTKADSSLQADQAGPKGLELVGAATAEEARTSIEAASLSQGAKADSALQPSSSISLENNYQQSSTSLDTSTFLYEASTFSGWSGGVGVVDPFSEVRFKIRSWNPAIPITQVRVRIRENNESGVILANKLVDFTLDSKGYLRVAFDEVVDSDLPLQFEYLTDGVCGILQTQVSGVSPTLRYTTARNPSPVSNSWVTITGSVDRIPFVEFYGNPTTQITDEGLAKIAEKAVLPIRVNQTTFVDGVVGELQQLFLRGMAETLDPSMYDIRISSPYAYNGGAGKQFPRYYEVSASVSGNQTVDVKVYSFGGELLGSGTITLRFKNPMTSPAANLNVLCLGDSLTAANVWVPEMRRRLAGSGGTPAGKAFSNITFIGTQGSDPAKHEGHSGKTWEWFATDAASPLTNGGSLDWSNYITSTLGKAGVDQVYIMLGWNDASSATAKRLASDWDFDTSFLNDLLDGLHTDFPLAKVTLMGTPLCSINGGLATNYGDASNGLGNVWRATQGVFGLNLALQQIASSTAYASFVDFADVMMSFDVENNMPAAAKAVNTRNATTEIVGTNGVHPSTSGYYQIADVAFRHFANRYCV
tara:strand:+ start:306 stop:2060 length:1755 start_codon:yes stop_codon:yes gene_type:complete